jgi:predicted NUDIX family NTP pyrophosphohydrolase
MSKISAGILVYRIKGGQVEALLAHPGGPFWAKKDLGAWSIIKGEIEEGEDSLMAAKREFKEETSHDPPSDGYMEIGEVKNKSGKNIKAWAVEADFDPKTIVSNNFEMEWPPKSGQMQEFPENDRAGWFDLATATKKINTSQSAFLERLAKELNVGSTEAEKSNQQQLL